MGVSPTSSSFKYSEPMDTSLWIKGGGPSEFTIRAAPSPILKAEIRPALTWSASRLVS